MSPNEYVRGSALRLAGKIRQAKIVEPLLEAILKNLVSLREALSAECGI